MDLRTLLELVRTTLPTDPQAVLLAADQCIRAAADSQARADEAVAWRVRGQALRALGQHAEAVTAFQTGADAALAAGKDLLAAQVRLGEIDSLGMIGRTEAAVALAERLERELREAGDLTNAAKVLCNLGSLHLRTDRYAEALDCYGQAEAIFATAGDALMRAAVQTNQAIALTYRNQIEAALGLYEEARETYTALKHEIETAIIETNIGFLHYVSGRYAGALTYLNRAYEVFAARHRTLEAARCDIDRGDAYRALNLLPESLECYERALAVFATLPLDYDQARAELGRAAVLLTQQRTEEGMASLDQAERLFLQLRNRLQPAHIRLIRASAHRDRGSQEEAVTLAGAATRIFARHRLPGWAAEARFLQVAVDLEKGRPSVRKMVAICRTAHREGRGWLECRAEHALGRHYTALGRTDLARRHLRRGVAALESARTRIAPEEMHTAFLRDKQAIYEDMVALLLARGRPRDIAEALECVERSRSRLLLDRVAAVAQQRLPLADTLQGRLATLRAELSRAYHQTSTLESGDPRRLPGASTPQLAEIERTYATALREAELQEMLPESEALIQGAVPLGRLQRALAPEETLLSFCWVRGALAVFVLRREGVRVLRNVARLENVVQAARRLRYHLQKMQMTQPEMQPLHHALCLEMEGVLGCLYDLLLRPLEPALQGKKLIVIPHGELHGLPFHAFHDGARYALDRWEFAYAPSAAIWYQVRNRPDRRETEKRETVLLVGMPGPGIERVALEVERLRETLPNARALVRHAATQQAVRVAAHNVDVLHLATHALFRRDNPHFSGVQLADGWLLARDLYDWTLHCRLVTLSACETVAASVEAGDELFGLVRGFLAAGARTVIGSYWPAEDAATAALMTTFYTARQQGMADGAALRYAQQHTRAAYPHPYHWAAFGLVGHSGP